MDIGWRSIAFVWDTPIWNRIKASLNEDRGLFGLHRRGVVNFELALKPEMTRKFMKTWEGSQSAAIDIGFHLVSTSKACVSHFIVVNPQYLRNPALLLATNCLLQSPTG